MLSRYCRLSLSGGRLNQEKLSKINELPAG
jgi:hypothetical protein